MSEQDTTDQTPSQDPYEAGTIAPMDGANPHFERIETTSAYHQGVPSADNPPYPARQHLDVGVEPTGDPLGRVDEAVGGGVAGATTVDPDGDDTDQSGYDADANVHEVQQWVGEDAERAQFALDQEQARSKPRSSLVDHLERVINEQDDPDA